MVALDCVVVMYINVTGFWVCTNLSVGISAADFRAGTVDFRVYCGNIALQRVCRACDNEPELRFEKHSLPGGHLPRAE